MPFLYRRLKGRIVEKYGTQEQFAKALDVSTNSLSLKMNGKTGFSQRDIERWRALLDITTDEIGDYFFT